MVLDIIKIPCYYPVYHNDIDKTISIFPQKSERYGGVSDDVYLIGSILSEVTRLHYYKIIQSVGNMIVERYVLSEEEIFADYMHKQLVTGVELHVVSSKYISPTGKTTVMRHTEPMVKVLQKYFNGSSSIYSINEVLTRILEGAVKSQQSWVLDRSVDELLNKHYESIYKHVSGDDISNVQALTSLNWFYDNVNDIIRPDMPMDDLSSLVETMKSWCSLTPEHYGDMFIQKLNRSFGGISTDDIIPLLSTSFFSNKYMVLHDLVGFELSHSTLLSARGSEGKYALMCLLNSIELCEYSSIQASISCGNEDIHGSSLYNNFGCIKSRQHLRQGFNNFSCDSIGKIILKHLSEFLTWEGYMLQIHNVTLNKMSNESVIIDIVNIHNGKETKYYFNLIVNSLGSKGLLPKILK